MPSYAPPPRRSPYRLFIDCTVWDEVYGFDMSVIKEIALTEPLVDVVDGKVRRDAYFSSSDTKLLSFCFS